MATMQNMTIDTQEMMTIARNFGSEINEWDSLVKRIWAALGEFDGMWEGDANAAFESLIESEKPKFEELSRMMLTYKEAIDKAAQKYENMEGDVSRIVSTRA